MGARRRTIKPWDHGPRADNCVMQGRLLGVVCPRLGSLLSALVLRRSPCCLCSCFLSRLRSSYLQGFLSTFDDGSLVRCLRFLLDGFRWSVLRLGCPCTSLPAVWSVLRRSLCLDRPLLDDRWCDPGLGLWDATSFWCRRCLSGHRVRWSAATSVGLSGDGGGRARGRSGFL